MSTDRDIPTLEFPDGIPGFPGPRRFALVTWGGPDSPYALLTDVDDADVKFLVVPPTVFFPAYEAEIDDVTAAVIGLNDPEQALVLVIVTLGDRVEDATANLLGPLVINLENHLGVQAVQPDPGLDTRAPLLSLRVA